MQSLLVAMLPLLVTGGVDDGSLPGAAPRPIEFTVRLDRPADADARPQPEVAAEPVTSGEARPRFGAAGTSWLTIGGGAAYDLDDATDANTHLAYSYFLVDNFELSLELAAWFHDQTEDEWSINPVLLFRWHLIARERWTMYLDAGVGVMFSTDSVPEGGTHVNFTPRVGVGFTHALGDSPARLQVGFRWHHISNARITGDRGNPARDAPMLYAAIVIPF